jgi:PAS domain S-box-containing protein
MEKQEAQPSSKTDFDLLVEYEKRGTLSSLIIESSDLAIKAKTLNGIITSWNSGAEKIYGYKEAEIIGKHVNILIPESSHPERHLLTKQISQGHTIPRFITKGVRKDGVIIDISIYLTPIKDEKGKIIGIATLDRDITELVIADEELAFQSKEKGKRADELIVANKELLFQNEEKEKRANELLIANKELAFQDKEKEKRANELTIANKELAFQNDEKEKRAAELGIANKELAFQNDEKEKRANELIIANKELAFQNDEKEKRAAELGIANKELAFQNNEKEKRAEELIIANKELVFQNEEKEKRAAELGIANKELLFQNEEKEKRAAELVIADIELDFQNKEKEKREIANKELEALSYAAKLASQYSLSLIEASRDPLVTINIGGKITDMNEATARITGMTREELKGSDFFDYFTEPQKAREVYQEVFAKGSVADSPLTLRHKDGKLTDVLFNGSVYKDDRGSVLGVVIVARDVTDQKRIATELTEAKVFAELATGIAEEAKIKAETATRIAEDAVKAKQQFLSNMSHEIRTPMNAIIGFTKVVLKTELTEKQKEYLNAIKVSGDALIVLINDILDLAKVDAGKMTFVQTPFKMAVSLSAMLHLFETKIQEKNLELIKEYDSNIPEVLIGDPVRLHQIILNLVSNAVKFTAQGKIIVSVNVLSEDDEKVTIGFAVSDTGIGISETKIERIFEDFQQATSGTSRLYGGTGLGLAIVKQLVEPQGGTINVTSKLGEGSTFSFVLSFQKTKNQTLPNTEIAEVDKEIKNIKVLVVEDIALNQLLMKTLLDDFGFERDIAANGKIAIEKLMQKSYDVILMDLQMPEMNGFEATEYIRNKMNSTIPIIALTADVTTVDLAKCKAVGMDDYIAKPVDERILFSKIISLVKKPIPIVEILKAEIAEIKKLKCIDLDYLSHLTKSDPKLMMEMISTYLEQTPPLIAAMKMSLKNKDWHALQSAAHKMIPSFSIVGISVNFANMAKKIQEYAAAQEQTEGIPNLILQLESVCGQACDELREEFNTIKTKHDAKHK